MAYSIYNYLSERAILLGGFNYDTHELFVKNDKKYSIYLGIPLLSLGGNVQLLIINEKDDNKWYFRQIKYLNETEDRYGIKEKYRRLVNETIDKEYEVNPKSLEGRLLNVIEDLQIV